MTMQPKFWRQLNKHVTLKASYGERKRKREEAKAPLLALLPGYLKEADEYQSEAIRGYVEHAALTRQRARPELAPNSGMAQAGQSRRQGAVAEMLELQPSFARIRTGRHNAN